MPIAQSRGNTRNERLLHAREWLEQWLLQPQTDSCRTHLEWDCLKSSRMRPCLCADQRPNGLCWSWPSFPKAVAVEQSMSSQGGVPVSDSILRFHPNCLASGTRNHHRTCVHHLRHSIIPSISPSFHHRTDRFPKQILILGNTVEMTQNPSTECPRPMHEPQWPHMKLKVWWRKVGNTGTPPGGAPDNLISQQVVLWRD